MNATFDQHYRQLGRATFGVLLATLSAYGITLLFAVLGLSRAVITFRDVTMSLGYVSMVLLVVFLLASLAAAAGRWMDQRQQLKGGTGPA